MNTQLSTEVLSPRKVSIRFSRPLTSEMKYVSSSFEAKLYIDDFFDLEDIDYKEHAWIILLTSGNRVLGSTLISIGHSKGTFMCAKEILQYATLSHASAVVLVHNHPSGKLAPSESDLKTTKNIKEALRLVAIELLDHIIITKEGYFSMADEHLLSL